jgi:hypothetical protein
MNTILTGLEGSQCFVYLDDIVIYASSIEEHSSKLKNVFQRLRINNLKLQPDKCNFMHREISFLGHIVTSEGVKPHMDKVKSILNFPTLKTLTIPRTMWYYRKFIPNLAKVAKPLTVVLKTDQNFIWTQEQSEAFDQLKSITSNRFNSSISLIRQRIYCHHG